MADEINSPEKDRTGNESFLSPWLDYRRKRFWAVAAVLLYTLTGFFLVPVLVSHLVVKNVHEKMDRTATIEKVRFNPYVLSLQVDGFDLADSDGETLFAFDTLFVNFQFSSLFRWAWTFREIRLDGAHLLYERYAPDDSRLSRLQADMARLDPGPADEEPARGMPRLLIGKISLNENSARFRDHLPGETVDLLAGPVSVTIQNLNTLPDHRGRHQVRIQLEDGAELAWQGDIDLAPFRSSGALTLEKLTIGPILPYLRTVLPIETATASLSARTGYVLVQSADGALSLELEGLESHLEGVSVTGLSPASEFLAFDALDVTGGRLAYPENTLAVEQIRLVNPFVDAWLDEAGTPGLLQLAPQNGSPVESNNAQEPSRPWQVSVAEFAIEGGRVSFTDRSIQPEGSLDLEGLDLSLRGIANAPDTRMPLTLGLDIAGGEAGFEGELTLLPALSLNGRAEAKGIALSHAQPWVQQQLALAIGDGSLSIGSEVSLADDGAFRAAGELAVDGLNVTDTAANEPLLAWERMAVDRFEFDTAAASARVSSVRFTKPYGRIHIAADLSTNIGGLVRDSGEPAAEPAPEEASSPGWSAVLGGIAIDGGSMDFSDFSLPLPFATKIAGLDGTISTLDSGSAEPSEITLEGQVDEFGLARIAGSMNLLDPIVHTDVSMEFRNLLMTNLSPYTVEFAGRKIDAGKLDLDLNYRIDNGLLNGQNAVVLSDLVLGEKVDNPDAASLPLGLAVALLKDSNGVIDVDLPVEGDVNNPEFKIGGVIWKAFVGMITKVVAAPFKLLGSLIGVESEDFGAFHFLAGRADLTPPELEKAEQLQQALAQRPELGLEISGAYDPAIDRPALQAMRLRAAVFERLGRDPTQEGNSDVMLDEEVRASFEAFYAERFPESSLEELKAAHTTPQADDPEGKPVFDATAYVADLRTRLIESEPVGEAELEALAVQRATTVVNTLLEDELDPGRVRQAAPTAVASEDGEWVVMELGVDATF